MTFIQIRVSFQYYREETKVSILMYKLVLQCGLIIRWMGST